MLHSSCECMLLGKDGSCSYLNDECNSRPNGLHATSRTRSCVVREAHSHVGPYASGVRHVQAVRTWIALLNDGTVYSMSFKNKNMACIKLKELFTYFQLPPTKSSIMRIIQCSWHLAWIGSKYSPVMDY